MNRMLLFYLPLHHFNALASTFHQIAGLVEAQYEAIAQCATVKEINIRTALQFQNRETNTH